MQKLLLHNISRQGVSLHSLLYHPVYSSIAIQLIADCKAYRLPRLLNEYLEFSGVNGFVSTIFEKQFSVKNPLDRHLKKPGKRWPVAGTHLV